MALINCAVCDYEMSENALNCPKCGEPNKVSSREEGQHSVAVAFGIKFIAVLVGAFIFALLIAAFQGNKNTVLRGEQTLVNMYETSAPNLNWVYSTQSDEMTGRPIYFASVKSQDTLSLGFPYDGTQRATLTARTHPRYGKNVYISLEKGQLKCAYRNCSIKVVFDNGKVQKLSASEAETGITEVLFINNYSRFMSKVLKAKEARIEASIFKEGTHTLIFDVSNFDISKYRPKK